MFKMTDEQREKVLRNFKKVIDKQNPRLINKELYYHLNLNCNFIAHFNLQGFREAYADENFTEFREFFNPDSPASQWLHAPETNQEYASLNQAMVEYANSQNLH